MSNNFTPRPIRFCETYRSRFQIISSSIVATAVMATALLLFPTPLSSQNYTQNALPIQQTKAADDCYTRNLDKGNAALRRGEGSDALRFFKEAKNCPEAITSTRKQADIDGLIDRCERQYGLKKATAAETTKSASQTAPIRRSRDFLNDRSNARRNYPANREFLKDTTEYCFQRTASEADRAYRMRFWEDAAALYRSAKNCPDADQKQRLEMSIKIIACRDAAENELFAKQQEAERQARHAIAANLADDAQEFLQTNDRTLAFRLADFANQYVAPDDNTDCVQAMFDAWYLQPSEDSKHRPDELYRPVFCYELADNLGENTQIKFEQQKDGRQWLWAFAPKTGEMSAWEMPGMKLEQTYFTGEGNGYTGFDLSPSGDLLFWGDNFFELRRGARTHRIPVASVAKWCFSKRGDEFFYWSPEEQNIYALNVRDALAYQPRKGEKKGNPNIVQSTVATERVMVSGVPDDLLSMQYFGGKFWLGFADRVEVLGKTKAGKPWKREQVIRFDGVEVSEYVDPSDLNLTLDPKGGFAVLYGGSTWFIPLEQKQDSTQASRKLSSFETMFPLAVSPSAHQVACLNFEGLKTNALWLMDAQTGDTLLRQWLLPSAIYEPMRGALSADGNWLAVTDLYGNVNMWALRHTPTSQVSMMPSSLDGFIVLSPDGERIFARTAETLTVLQTDDTQQPEHRIPNKGGVFLGKSNHWVMVHTAADSAEARNLSDGRSWRFSLSPMPSQAGPYFFSVDSKEEELLAYVADWNTVHIRSLKTGALLKSKAFDGGTINHLRFIPKSNDLLVMQRVSQFQSTAKIWSPLREAEKPRSLRLNSYYNISTLAVDSMGQWIALSDNTDIRVFEVSNIANEWVKMPKIKDGLIRAIAFRPNSNLLAAAYSNGEVVFWDIQTGHASLELQAVPSKGLIDGEVEIMAMGFSSDGTRLQVAVSDGRFYTYELDPYRIRSAAQGNGKYLQSFTAEHIRRYRLEAALYYPGNFEQLAESDDAPLIRSFFEYFREEAISSNNVQRARDYCERALYLFERLSTNTQDLWKTDMRYMYEDYAWKLLLRGNTNEAAQITAFITERFDSPALLAEAHTALLDHNFAAASERYSEFVFGEVGGLDLVVRIGWATEKVVVGWQKFNDYELLDSAQIRFTCEFRRLLSGNTSPDCAQVGRMALPVSANDRAQWDIYEAHRAAKDAQSFEARIAHLKSGIQKSRTLRAENIGLGQSWEETTVLELGLAQCAWGIFEDKSPEAPPHFEKAVQLLGDFGEFKILPDTSRLSLIASAQLLWGNYLLEAGKIEAAVAQYAACYQTAQRLLAIADTTYLPIYHFNLMGPLFKQYGTANLLLGNMEGAREAYEQADEYYSYTLEKLYYGNIAVLENNADEALLNYGDIYWEYQAALAFFELDRLAKALPEKRAQIEAFIPRLRYVLNSQNRNLANTETDYWLASLKEKNFVAQGQWDSAIVWATLGLKSAKHISEHADTYDEATETYLGWSQKWLDEHVSLCYYLLLGRWDKPETFDEVKRYTDAAEEFLGKQDSAFQYANRVLLKINLGHAYLLRNKPGDREQALELYEQFRAGYADPRGVGNLEILRKDLRDIRRAGAPLPIVPEIEGGTMNDE